MWTKIRIPALSLISLLFGHFLVAQQILPLNRELYQEADKHLLQKPNMHSMVKPYTFTFSHPCSSNDSLIASHRAEPAKRYPWLYRKLRYEHFIQIDSADYSLYIDPLANLYMSFDENNERYYTNTRGVAASGRLGNNFAFYTDFYENQSFFPDYINAFVERHRVIPGQGFRKRFKETGYDYAYANGLISYKPSKTFDFVFGHGKNFVGDGYRSLLLSDAAFNYPFLRIDTEFWKIKYTNIYASFLDLRQPYAYSYGFTRKYGTFHVLSYNVTKNINIGLFESVIWQAVDSTGKRGYDVNYLNPVIFYHPVQYSLGSPDNVLVGLNLRINLSEKFILYGQGVLDDIDIGRSKKGKGFILNKFGGQGGFRWYDPFKLNNLFVQAELNAVKPYVYAHKTPLQNYAHYEQSLAHPLGANFVEAVSILNYRYKNFFTEFKITYAIFGADTGNSHWGKNIYKSDFDAQLGFVNKGSKPGDGYGNEILQGVRTTLSYQDIRFSYLVNPKTNLNVCVGVTGRMLSNYASERKDLFVYMAIRTSLNNLYFDF